MRCRANAFTGPQGPVPKGAFGKTKRQLALRQTGRESSSAKRPTTRRTERESLSDKRSTTQRTGANERVLRQAEEAGREPFQLIDWIGGVRRYGALRGTRHFERANHSRCRFENRSVRNTFPGMTLVPLYAPVSVTAPVGDGVGEPTSAGEQPHEAKGPEVNRVILRPSLRESLSLSRLPLRERP